MEPDKKEIETVSSFRKGTKVKYRHGRGYALGTFVGTTDDGLAIITTKNGAETTRQIDGVLKADPAFIEFKNGK